MNQPTASYWDMCRPRRPLGAHDRWVSVPPRIELQPARRCPAEQGADRSPEPQTGLSRDALEALDHRLDERDPRHPPLALGVA